jgi:hypothetical protein
MSDYLFPRLYEGIVGVKKYTVRFLVVVLSNRSESESSLSYRNHLWRLTRSSIGERNENTKVGIQSDRRMDL